MSLLDWRSLLFLIPLGTGGLLALGAALGLLEGDADGEHGGDDDCDGEGGDGSTWLALGRVPLTVRLLLLTLPFGSLGLAAMYLLAGRISPGLGVSVAVLVGAVGTWIIGGRLARLFRTHVRTVETETVARRDLVGAEGRVVLPVGASWGLAQVHDRRGNLHQVGCRTMEDEAPLASGTEILLVDYDEGQRVYHAVPNPGRG